MSTGGESETTTGKPDGAGTTVTVVRGYDDVRRFLAEWCAANGVTRAELDARLNWSDGYAGHVLSPRATKKFGLASLFWLCQVLDLEIAIVKRSNSDRAPV